MISISARLPMNTFGDAVVWERTIGGVHYWFNATPYEVKVFRLRLDGGDLVHHWRDVPETVGQYDWYDRSTWPAPGQVAWSAHWDRNITDRVYYTGCRVCGDVVEVTREQLVSHHGDRYGTRTCDGSGSTATLKAALLRDDQPSAAESAMATRVHRWLGSCTGYDVMYGGKCYHPGCQTKKTPAAVLELRALHILRSPDSALARFFTDQPA